MERCLTTRSFCNMCVFSHAGWEWTWQCSATGEFRQSQNAVDPILTHVPQSFNRKSAADGDRDRCDGDAETSADVDVCTNDDTSGRPPQSDGAADCGTIGRDILAVDDDALSSRPWFTRFRDIQWLSLSLSADSALHGFRSSVSTARIRSLCWSTQVPAVRQFPSTTRIPAAVAFLCDNVMEGCEPAIARPSSAEISLCFDVYEPQASFKRTAPGLPSFRMLIASEDTTTPSASELVRAARIGADGVPVKLARIDGHQVIMYSLQ